MPSCSSRSSAPRVLVVAVGLLGLRVLGQSNDRVETARRTPGTRVRVRQAPERRVACSAAARGERRTGRSTRSTRRVRRSVAGLTAVAIDQAVAERARTHRARYASSTASGSCRLPRTSASCVGSVGRARSSRCVMREIIELGDRGAPAETRAASSTEPSSSPSTSTSSPTVLADATTAKTDDLDRRERERVCELAEPRSSASRRGRSSSALLLGLVLSWSVIGPIQRIDARLATIASGDFSGHVDVSNRDELGGLAANVNRMNDELDRLYRRARGDEPRTSRSSWRACRTSSEPR